MSHNLLGHYFSIFYYLPRILLRTPRYDYGIPYCPYRVEGEEDNNNNNNKVKYRK